MAEDKKGSKLDSLLSDINKKFGNGTVLQMKDDNQSGTYELVSTRSIGLDNALGGGLPKGRIVELIGEESSGKTTLATHIIAEVQSFNGIAAFIDVEHAFDKFYAAKLGVDTDALIYTQPQNGEQALEIADQLIKSGEIAVIVIDSVAALVPKSELEGEMGDSKMGAQARMMSQALRKMTGHIAKSNTLVIFINQTREKIGIVFGNPMTTPGGNALKFYASVRLNISRSGQIKDGDEVVGSPTKVKVMKNKVAPPFKVATFDIIFNEGISKVGEIVDLGVEFEIVKKAGSWFSYGDTKLGQGREMVKQVLLDNPELADELEAKIRVKLSEQ